MMKKTESSATDQPQTGPAGVFYVTVYIQATPLTHAAGKAGVDLAVALAKACSLALANHPLAYCPGASRGRRGNRHDLGLARIAGGTTSGPLTLADVGNKTPAQLQAEWAKALERAQAGKSTAADRAPAGFIVEDLLRAGVDHATPLPRPGHPAALGVAAPTSQSWSLCLGADAGCLDNAQASAFLAELKGLLEQPDWLTAETVASPAAEPARTEKSVAATAAKPVTRQAAEPAWAIPAGGWDVQVAVIGGGPGGEDCARDLADHGVKVALINDAPLPGGECLWRGCIPSKVWRHAADLIRDRKHDADKGVLGTNRAMLDWTVLEGHRRTVQESRGEMALRADKGMKIAVHEGRARFLDDHHLEVQPRDDEAYTISFGAAVIATGAPPFVPPIPGAREGLAGGGVLTSDSIWNLAAPPRKLGIIGGGVIGVEMAQIWHDLGAQVLVLEAKERILAELEEEIGKQLHDIVSVEVDVAMGASIGMITGHPGNMMIQYSSQTGSRHQYLCDYVLMATGKRPATAGLSLEAAGVELDGDPERGAPIRVDAHCRTSVPHIYAVGDVIGGYMLAHTAAAQGRVAAENILGHAQAYDPDLDCAVTFSRPQAGFVGITAAQAKARGLEVMEAKMPMALDAKAMISLETQGLIKLVAEKDSGRVVGVHFLADHTDTLIGAAVMMVSGGMTLTQVAQAIFPHPTQTEIFGELARRLLARLRRSKRA